MSFIVTPAELNRRAEMYHQLGSAVSAGVPLIRSLEMIATNRAVATSRKSLQTLIDHLKSGMTFTESMLHLGGWLPEFDKALLSVGEESGRLDATFKLLARYYGLRAQIIRDTISGLITTILTLHVFLLVFPLGLLTSFILGFFNNQYAQCIPFVVEKAVVFGGLYGIVLFLIFACQGQRGEGWRSFVESIFQCVPILRTARKYLALSRLTAALEALTNAGVSIVKGWPLAATASGSSLLKAKISQWDVRIAAGETPAELINETGYFPEMFANLYYTGEQSGKLDETLTRLHMYYQEEGFRTLRLFTRILNGTIYGLVVALVAINVIHFYMSYYGGIFNNF